MAVIIYIFVAKKYRKRAKDDLPKLTEEVNFFLNFGAFVLLTKNCMYKFQFYQVLSIIPIILHGNSEKGTITFDEPQTKTNGNFG